MHHSISLLIALASVAVAGAASAQPAAPLYLELWQPTTEPDATPDSAAETPRLLVSLGPKTVSAPIANWCAGLRLRGKASILPEALLQGAEYDFFATDTVPLRLEILIDDVELRYAMGTERPAGTTGVDFPYFELCAVGFGSREQPTWKVEVLHVANHRGDDVALGLYKGALPASERHYLETQFGYPLDLPDPAGLLLLGSGQNIDTLVLVESTDSAAFDSLRQRIFR